MYGLIFGDNYVCNTSFTHNGIFETEDTYLKQLQWVPFATSKMMHKKLLVVINF